MSHTMNIEIELHDRAALEAACQRLNLTISKGRHKLYQTTEEGLAVHLQGWKYPAVIKKDGKVACDTYNGRWGDMAELNKLRAYYGLEKAKIEARKQGYSVYETVNSRSQKLELRIRVGG